MSGIIVKDLGSMEEKGVAQVEQELLEKHEQQLNPTPEPEPQPEPEPTPTPEDDIDDNKVLSYIGKRYNKQINSIDELIAERNQNEELPEDVSAFLKYKKETGRGINDFMKLNRDYDAMDGSDVVREYLRETQEGLDDDDISTLMEQYEYDEDLDDDSRVKQVKIERKKIINEAKKYFNAQKEQYKVPLESSGPKMSPEEKEEYESYRQYVQRAKSYEEESKRRLEWFAQKTEEVFSKDFKGFEFDVNDRKIVFNPGDAAELKKTQLNPENYIKKFVDDKGLLKDAVGYHKSLAIAMNPEKFAKYFYEQGLSDATDNLNKKIRNVNMSPNRATEIAKQNDGFSVRAVNPDSGRSLKIRSAKKM